jgi:hypothetical protein
VPTVPNPKYSDRVELFRAKPVPLVIGTALGLVRLKHGVAWQMLREKLNIDLGQRQALRLTIGYLQSCGGVRRNLGIASD